MELLWPITSELEKSRRVLLNLKEDFAAAVAHLKGHNVKFRIEPLATPVWRMAMIYDPDGNSICVHKRNPGR